MRFAECVAGIIEGRSPVKRFRVSMLGIFLTALFAQASVLEIDDGFRAAVVGPTTFQQMSKDPWRDFATDFIYLRHNLDPNLRRVARINCSGHDLSLVTIRQVVPEVSEDSYLQKNSCSRNSYQSLLPLTKTVAATEFDLQDQANLARLNDVFYRQVQDFGTLSLQHGKPTDEVYIFLPGLYWSGRQFLDQAMEVFWRGSNVLVTTMPGFDRHVYLAAESEPAMWLAYTEWVARMARQYGKKVILVGQSTGGQLAIRMAESGLADGLILFEPFLGMRTVTDGLLRFGNKLPDAWLDLRIPHVQSSPKDLLQIGLLDQKLLPLPHRKIASTIFVDITILDNDLVVAPSAIEDWVKLYAPHATVRHRWESEGHNFLPPVKEWAR
jgi:pimeloyl-ACP methyl ester carboxylesterase